jgi:predicted MFS family arabinose efflux permease
MTMYDPAFAVVTRRYGTEARMGITAITLWGGFASTVFVPVTQWLQTAFGWREAVLILGVCNLAICIALHAWLIDPGRDAPPVAAPRPESGSPAGKTSPTRWVLRQPAFWGLLVAFTIYYGMYGGLTFHLYPMLLERGFSAAVVVGALSIIGPAQVAGRIAMWVFAKHRPVRVVGLVAIGAFPFCVALLILLPNSFWSLAVFATICGGANGVVTIVRGLVVPEMLTRESYGAINGMLSLPATVTKALAPVATASLWDLFGSYDAVLWAALASAGAVVVAFAFATLRTRAAVGSA